MAGLTQSELGTLIGVSEDVIGNCERAASNPTARILVGSMLIFGKSPADLFPGLYKSIQENIGRQAAKLDNQWHGSTDATILKKLQFLQQIAERSIALDL